MLPQKIEKILIEYQMKYRKAGVDVSLDNLKQTAKAGIKEAEKNYTRLESPKTSCKETYITYWVRENLEKDLARKTIIKIDRRKFPSEPYFQAISEYFSLLPIPLLYRINQEINNTPPAKREKLWKDLNFPIEEAKSKFIRLISTRIEYFLKKEKMSPLEFSLKQFNIPKKDFQRFKSEKYKTIKKYNELFPNTGNLPFWFYSEYNLPCFVCRLAKLPFEKQKEALEFVFQKYPSFSAFKSKVKIKTGESTSIKYDKTKDNFLITIDNYANFRHQIMGLIHEMSHVISFLKNFQNGLDPLEKGRYFQEKDAINIEFSLLKDLSEDLFRASLAKALIAFWTTIFETELYKNPNQNDIEKLYAKTFNLCFIKANQKRNPFYLLNDKILTAPFSSLPHVVAYTNIPL